ncbi:MAG TPA: glycosyltransferase family 2 protein [Patescibacteria group bacterium]|nr:glycosyltransferase family 2 protein [Patescibacteria group bacterium]
MKSPLITISIPTYNSEKFIGRCLEAIKRQNYSNIEINIIDGGSTDQTVNIARKEGIKDIFICKDALLAARFEGVKHAKGEFVLLLDSDQILDKTAIARAVEKIEANKLDMLVLEEHVYKPQTFLEHLFEADRKLIHEVADMSPYTGVVLPRFYKRRLLESAMKKIPKDVLLHVGGQDHAIIYYEAWQKSQKVGLLETAVFHIEPSSYRVMWQKFYRWGRTSAKAHHSRYDKLLVKKERFRTGLFRPGLIKASLASVVLLILKGIPYKLGYYQATLLS